MATFSQVLSKLGAKTEYGLITWAETAADTYRWTSVDGYKITVTGAYDPEIGFTGGAVLTDTVDTQRAELSTTDGEEAVRLLQWLYSNAKQASVTIDMVVAAFVAELEA